MSRDSEKDLVDLFTKTTQEPDRFGVMFVADKKEQRPLIRVANRNYAEKSTARKKLG